MKSLPILILSLLLFSVGQAQDTNRIFRVSVRSGFGFMVPHHDDMWRLVNHHLGQCELQLSKQYFSNEDHKLTRKEIGISFYGSGTGNAEETGYAFGLYPFFNFPISKAKNPVNFQLGCGLGYLSRIYSEENFKNNAIGSHFNAFISLGLTQRLHITRNLDLSFSVGWTHFSNGASKAPNLGINLPSARFSIDYLFHKPYRIDQSVENAIIEVPPKLMLFGSISFKQIRIDGPHYTTQNLMAEYAFAQNSKRSWIIGTDFTLDLSMQAKMADDNEALGPFSQNLKIGLKTACHFHIDDLTIVLQAGSYIKNVNFNKEFIFQRLALRYKMNKKAYFHIALRSHFAKADAIEFGLGYRLW